VLTLWICSALLCSAVLCSASGLIYWILDRDNTQHLRRAMVCRMNVGLRGLMY